MRTVKIRIIGRVQGVFYRLYAKKKAKELGITGWAKNETDGSVLILASGDDQRVEEMINWCHTGSPWAKVSKVEAEDEVGQDELIGFEVK